MKQRRQESDRDGGSRGQGIPNRRWLDSVKRERKKTGGEVNLKKNQVSQVDARL